MADQMGHVFWSQSGDLETMNGDGTGLRTIVRQMVDGGVIAIDDSSAYFEHVDGPAHRIFRVCK